MTDRGREAIALLLKNRQSDNRRSYLVRGRRYEQLSEKELRATWADQMNRWAGESSMFDQRALNDLGIEMQLREIAPPLELITEAARQKILAKSGMALATIASDRRLTD